MLAHNKEGIRPVATLSIALYVLRRATYVSQRHCARGGKFVIGFINIDKYTSVSENVHLSLRTLNWVTLVSLLVEYLLYSVVLANRTSPSPFRSGFNQHFLRSQCSLLRCADDNSINESLFAQ